PILLAAAPFTDPMLVGTGLRERSAIRRVWTGGPSMLPHTLREVHEVAAAVQRAHPGALAVVLDGPRATRDQVVALSRAVRLVLVATHGGLLGEQQSVLDFALLFRTEA